MSVRKIKKFNNAAIFKKRTANDDNVELTHRIVINARKTGELNFSSRGLSSVPDGVWTINNLTKDEINKLKNDMDFDDDDRDRWWEQESLKILNLSSNTLTFVDKKIEYLEDLVNFDIHDNLLEDLPDQIGTLTKLAKLNISHNKLININANIFILENLRYLDLSYNNLTEINSSIGDLVMLEYLNLSNNEISKLPIGLGYLVRLETCDISNNKLIELPPDIMSMRVLKKLNASSNHLEIIPPLGEMRKLENLIINSNNLKIFPDISGCILLKELNLSNNLIDEINMEYLDGMGQLRSILMANNKIVSIPDDIIKLLNLEQLDLSFNKLTIIPNVICIMPNLKSFVINDNPVKNIRRDIIQCGTVRILKHLRQGLDSENIDLSELPCSPVNSIRAPDKYTMRHTKLLSLTAQNLNEIQETILDDAITAGVTCVDLSKNKLKQLPSRMALLNLIEDLKISCNQLVILPDWIGESFCHLRYLDISRNQLEILPQSIGLLERLREINISFNKFKKIPECLYNILNLEIMFVNDNQIDEINADSLAKLYRLATLDFSNNNIKHVPAELGNQKNLSHFSSVINGHCIACKTHAEIRCHNIAVDWKLFQTTETRYPDERNR